MIHSYEFDIVKFQLHGNENAPKKDCNQAMCRGVSQLHFFFWCLISAGQVLTIHCYASQGRKIRRQALLKRSAHIEFSAEFQLLKGTQDTIEVLLPDCPHHQMASRKKRLQRRRHLFRVRRAIRWAQGRHQSSLWSSNGPPAQEPTSGSQY